MFWIKLYSYLYLQTESLNTIKYEKEIKNEDCITVKTQVEYEQDKVYARHIILDSKNNEMALLESYWKKIICWDNN